MTTTTTPVPAHDATNHDGLHRALTAVRGVVAIVIGVLALYFRVYSTLLVGVFVVFAIVEGLVRLVIAIRSTGRDRAWLIHALEGILSIAFGVIAFKFTRNLVSFTWAVAEWAGGIGVLTIIFAIVMWRRLHDAWLWLLSGVLLIALGVAVPIVTTGGLLAPGVALGALAILYGVASLLIALRARRRPPQPLAPETDGLVA